MTPRYIAVAVAGRPEPVEVRVVSQHPTDDKLRQQLYRVEALWDWCDGQDRVACGYWQADPETGKNVWIPPSLGAGDIDRAIETSSGVKVRRDEARRELCKLVLADKLSGQQVEEMLESCTIADIQRIFQAAKGIDLDKLLTPSLPGPTTNSTPKAG
jgi:hypothetical protein